MTRRAAVGTLVWLVPAICWATWQATDPKADELLRRWARTKDARIVELQGRASIFELGQEIARLRELVEEVEGGSAYRVPGSDLTLHVAGGKIDEIAIADHFYLTQRLIRPRRSTLKEVAAAYGMPATACTRQGRVLLVYDGIAFSFETPAWKLVGNQAGLLAEHVAEVILSQRGDPDPLKVYGQAMDTWSRGEVERAIEGFERSVCEHRRLRSTGSQQIAPGFSPHAQLARAWRRLGRCEAARLEARLALSAEAETLDDAQRVELRRLVESSCD